MKPTPLGAVVVGALLLAACGSDRGDDADSFGSGQPTTAGVTEVPDGGDETETDADPEPGGVSTTPPGSDVATTPGPLPEPRVDLVEIGTFDQPVEVAARPGDDALYVVEQAGRVIALRDGSADVVLDITDLTEARGEQGLLGLAFHPNADLVYVNFTNDAGDTVVAEFPVDPDTGELDRDGVREVLTIDQPYTNHNGGQLAFGPDGQLYVGVGDGGSGGDPDRYALDLTSRLGKILRIDPVVSGDESFGIPPDNPFAGQANADPTIWSYGLRNPWRFSFDPLTGDLWIGDVGQGDFEEINRAIATDGRDAGRGTNYGWSAFEGFERFNDDQPDAGAVAPLFVYDHGDGRCSVTGGAVARSDAAGDLAGWYVFGDYCTGQIWALDPTAPPTEPRVIQIAQLGGLAAVAVGPERDLYAVSNGGTVARLISG